MRKAVYGGTFDPPTDGHMWVIKQGAKLFDELIVVVATNVNKQPMYSVEERVSFLKHLTSEDKNVSVEVLDNKFLADFAWCSGAEYILRGIRDESDFRYESEICAINEKINFRVNTVFLRPPKELIEIRSSIVKSLIGVEGWEKIVSSYVPPLVMFSLNQRIKQNGKTT